MQTNFISEQYTAITRDLDRLATLIRRLPHRDARVAAITPTAKGSESEPTTNIVVLEQTGPENPLVRVKSGLTAEERVVVAGVSELQEGQKIRPGQEMRP